MSLMPPVGAVIVGPLIIGAAVLALIGVGALYLTRGGAQSRRIAAANRSRRSGEVEQQAQQTDPLDAEDLDALRRRAGSLLVGADEAVRSSEQEVLFAQASYGDEQVAVFREDIDEARRLLTESFRLQQQADHAERDLDPSREDLDEAREDAVRGPLKQIVENCRRIDATLEQHRREFEDLRSLERDPGPAADQLADQLGRLRDRRAAAEQRLAELRENYDPSAFPQYVANLRRTGEELDEAETALARAREAVEASRASDAVVALHQGEEEASDAADLLDSMETTSGRLAEARRGLDGEVADAEQDLAQARAILEAGQAPELAGPIAATEQAVHRVRTALDGEAPIDPLELLDQLETAHRELDAPLEEVRDRQAQDRRARASLQTELLSARNQVQSSVDFLRSRRRQVGSTARTRMAEAERCLAEAHAQENTEPAKALQSATQAKQLAVQAAQIAERERAEGNLTGGAGFGGMGMGGMGMGGVGMGGGRDYGAPGGFGGVLGSPGRGRRRRRF